MVRAAAPEILAFPGVEHPSPSRSPALKDALGNAAGGPGQAAGQGWVGMIFTCRADLGFRGGCRSRASAVASDQPPLLPPRRVSKRHSAFKLGRGVTPITLLEGFNDHVELGQAARQGSEPAQADLGQIYAGLAQ